MRAHLRLTAELSGPICNGRMGKPRLEKSGRRLRTCSSQLAKGHIPQEATITYLKELQVFRERLHGLGGDAADN
jgi:hypothetical protein